MASEATGVSGLAGRYATALFELADQQRELDRVADDLARLGTLIAESSDLQRLIRSPILSRTQQNAAMTAILDRAGISTLTRNLVGLVTRNRRLFALPAIADAYLALLAERRGEVAAEVTSAQALSDAQRERITERLRNAVGSKVTVKLSIDPAILGGLIVKVGSRMVDGSLRTKLQRLQLAMKGI